MASVLVAITCRNYEQYLADAIRSVELQTVPCGFRIFHDDCGGKDPVGVARNRNRVLEDVRAKYVIFLDADDTLSSGYVEKLLQVAKGDRCIVACDGHRTGLQGGIIRVETPITLESLLVQNTVHVSALVSLDLLREHGGFSPAFSAYEDWELWCRLAYHGAEFRYCPDTHLMIRCHPGSRHSQKTVPFQEMRDILRSWYELKKQ